MKDVLDRLRYDNGKLYWTKVNSNAIKVGSEAGHIDHGRHGDRRKIRVGDKQLYTSVLIYTMFHGTIPAGMKVDHKDGDTMNNRIDNLRLLDNALNVRNSTAKVGKWMRGVRQRGQRFQAYFTLNGKQKSLGTFATELGAHQAHLAANEQHYPGILQT